MSTHNEGTYAYGQHWAQVPGDDPQPLGSCDDPRGCPPSSSDDD